ncbi:MAG: Do family serine endopeptidase [Spirochaetes bacterium]|nr:Do family serine endopeptidase [Spirochaetota bacterium]
MKIKKFLGSKGFLAVNIFLITAVAVILVVSLSGFGGRGEQQTPQPVNNQQPSGTAVQPQQTGNTSGSGGIQALKEMQFSFRTVASRVIPTVVEVDVVDIIKQPVPQLTNPFEFFFGPQGNNQEKKQYREYKQYGLGSGVIVKRSGNKVYVLTNNHVVGKAEEISIKLHDQRIFKAKLVGKDEKKDLALVVFKTKQSVPIAELGDSNTLQVGDWVLAVGNPLGFESTVTAGIVSAIGRHPIRGSGIATFTNYIQTDAAINRGNSGGALVNLDGQVVGINSWIASPSGGSIGLGFAIPINTAKKAINEFITKGKIEYGWLGVSMGDVSPQIAAGFGLKNHSGAFIYGVFKGSPAGKSGILPGDIITKINNRTIKDSTELLMTIGDLPPNHTITIGIYRYGTTTEVKVKLATREEEKKIAKKADKLWPGLYAVPITPDIRKQLKLSSRDGDVILGNVIQGSPAAIAGFRPGDIVKKINGTDIKTLTDFYKALNNLKERKLLFNLVRENNSIIIGLVR